MNSDPRHPINKLYDRLFKTFEEFYSEIPSFFLRDKTGFRHMEIEIEEETPQPCPFPCLVVRVWVNGKGDNTPIEIEEENEEL